MSNATTPEAPGTRHGVRGVLIVAQDQPDLWQALHQEFGDSGVISVLLDRRQGERRRSDQFITTDRRRNDRRSLLHIEEDLRLRHYVLVRPHARRPHD